MTQVLAPESLMEEVVDRAKLLDMLDANNSSRDAATRLIQGRMLSLSQDSVGCRVVQRALEVCSLRQQLALVKELHGNVAELITSPHGIHVLQKTVCLLPPWRSSFIAQESTRLIQGHMLSLSQDSAGCRVVQRALEVCSKRQQGALVEELHGNVTELIRSPHGNYVLQKIVCLLPPSSSSFIAQEFTGTASEIAHGEYGCRVVMRLFENCMTNSATVALADELLLDSASLCRGKFGHHTMEKLLQHGLPRHRRALVETIMQNLWTNAMDRSATYVLKAAFSHAEWGPDEEGQVPDEEGGLRCALADPRCALAEGLMQKGESGVKELQSSEWGKHVFRALRWFVGRHHESMSSKRFNPSALQALLRI